MEATGSNNPGKAGAGFLGLNNLGEAGAGYLLTRPHETSPTKLTVGKEGLNLNSRGWKYPTGSLVLQTDYFRYDYLTSSSCPTTLNMMARPTPSSGSESTLSQSN
jgi:hypothetical protein